MKSEFSIIFFVGTRMENVTSSQIPTFTVTSDNTCPKSCLLTKQSSIPPG